MVYKQSIRTLEDGWSFSVNGEPATVQPSHTLSSYIFPSIAIGDTVTLSRRFVEPDDPNRMLSFDTWHSVTKAYLDGRQIYTYGEALAQSGRMLGTFRHNVYLPDQYSGKMLTLEFTATEADPMPYLTSVAFYAAGDPAILWFNRPVGLLIFGSFFIFLGIVIAFTSCIFIKQKSISLEQLSLGICVILTGAYILSRGNFLQLILPDPLVYNAVEYISLFLLPIPILTYWLKTALACRRLGLRLGYFICMLANILFVAGSVILNFTSAIHLCQLLPVYYLLVLFVAVVIFTLIRFQGKAEDVLRKKIYTFGINTFIVGSILSIVAFRLCYNTVVANAIKLWSWYNYILPFSMCMLVLFFTMAFVVDMKQLLENSFRHEFLQYAAYSDVLTQLYNRRSFNEDLGTLDVSAEVRHYGIISIDLNDLKHVNDTLGHSAGDLMLEDFSKLLIALCDNEMKAYRLGGDEFAVVATRHSQKSCAEFLIQLLSAVDDYNKAEHAFRLSAAYGLATSEEAGSVEAVLELADKRMYQRKKEMKSCRNG